MNYYIVNPNAGSNNQESFLKISALIKTDPNHILWKTTEPKEAFSLAQKALEQGASRIIAVGGDGTINEVASALVGKSTPLGIIPVGSGNGLARHLKIPLNYTKAFQTALIGTIIKMDVGYINNKAFFCTAGIGFDAVVAHCFANSKGRGLLNYMKASFKSLWKYKPIEISVNDGATEKVFSLSIANANQFGNNAYISPFSNIQDGKLELVKIGVLNKIQACILAIRLFKKNIHQSSKVDVIASSNARILYAKNAPIHMDGENLFTDSEELKISISPLALEVII